MGFSCRQCIVTQKWSRDGRTRSRRGLGSLYLGRLVSLPLPSPAAVISSSMSPFAGAAGGAVHGACRSPMTGWVSLSRRRQWCLALGREGGLGSQSGCVLFRLKHHAPPFQNALAPSPSPSLFWSPPLFHATAKKWEKKIQTVLASRWAGAGCQLVCWGQCVRLFSTVTLEEETWPVDGGKKDGSRASMTG